MDVVIKKWYVLQYYIYIIFQQYNNNNIQYTDNKNEFKQIWFEGKRFIRKLKLKTVINMRNIIIKNCDEYQNMRNINKNYK